MKLQRKPMRCPTLTNLPSSLPHKVGWPWTEESPKPLDSMPDGSPWPRISIVTPSLNQGQYIEETIRSILLQGYPDLEFIIMDGGSTDGSLEIIRKYEPWLCHWVSEQDLGQSNAINKGMSIATGEIVNWINSDDSLLPSGLQVIAQTYSGRNAPMVIGAAIDFDEGSLSELVTVPRQVSVQDIIRFWEGWFSWTQPSIFFSRERFFQTGGLDQTLHFSMDIDLYCRLMQIAPVVYTSVPIAMFRRHKKAKTQAQYHGMMLEHIKVVSRYKQLLDYRDAKAFEAQTARFLLRRMKRLLLDGGYRFLIQYLRYTLIFGRYEIFKALSHLVLSKLKTNPREINSP